MKGIVSKLKKVNREDLPKGERPPLREVIDKFNIDNQNHHQPFSNKIKNLFNELDTIEFTITINRSYNLNEDMRRYREEFQKLIAAFDTDRLIKCQFVFGKEVIKVDSQLFLADIAKSIRRIQSVFSKNRIEKKSKGQPPSIWSETLSGGKEILNTLYASGITRAFVAHYYGVKEDTLRKAGY